MANKTIGDLKIGDRAVLKSPEYGTGTLVGINSKTNERFIGYKSTDPKHSGAFSNPGGKFPDSFKMSDKVKDYAYFYCVPHTLELHNNESGNDNLNVGDRVEVYTDTNNNFTTSSAKAHKRNATVIGFYETGDALLYFDNDSKSEIGVATGNTLQRHIHETFDGKIDLDRRAFINSNGFIDKGWMKKIGKVKVKKMSNNNGDRPAFMEMVKADAVQAAYRVAATQMSNGTKAAILTIMEKNGQGSDRIAALSDLLNTEFGNALVSLLLGVGLNYAPMLSDDPRAQKLATEFRINGMATAGNAVMDTAMQHFLPVITNALSALPEETTQKRIASVPAEEIEEETKAEAPKTATV